MAEQERKLLIDNDAFVLFAGAGMLDAVLQLLGFAPADVLRLPSLPSMLGRGRAFKDYPPDVKQRAQIACERFATVDAKPDAKLLQALVGVQNIDDTDAVLYALLAENPNWMFLSGDKRAMKALCNEPTIAHVRDAVRGRVVCIEMVVDQLVRAATAAAICEAFKPLRPVSRTLSVVLSDGNAADHAQCLIATTSYYADIKSDLTDGFLFERN